MIRLEVDPQSLRRLCMAVGVANTVILGLFAAVRTGRISPGLAPVPELDPAVQFNLQREGGIAAVWYSSSLYLLIAMVAIVCHLVDRSRTQGEGRRALLRHGWLVLAAAAVFLSLDESAQVHEGIGYLVGLLKLLHVGRLTDGSPVFVWVLLYSPLLLGGGVLLAGFFFVWLAPFRRSRALAFIGITCWAVVPVLELVESQICRTFGEIGAVPEQIGEESLEIIGATALVVACVEYLISQQHPAAGGIGPDSRDLRSVTASVAAPLLLIPAAGLLAIFDAELRSGFADAGFRYSAYRLEMVMFNADRHGNYLLASESCTSEALAATMPYDVVQAGYLVDFPPADHRLPSPQLVLTSLALPETEQRDRLHAGLQRISLLGTHLAPALRGRFGRRRRRRRLACRTR